MKKTDKKIDNNIRLVLTEVCEQALKEIAGFMWLTHTVNYQKFPSSLKITCVFDTNLQLAEFKKSKQDIGFSASIKAALLGIDINVKNITKFIEYDTEENCTEYNAGNWAKRLAS